MKTPFRRFAAALVLCGAASPVVAQPLADLAWMSGSWIERKDGVETEEHWLAPKGGMLVAVNRTVAAARTSFELLRIEMRDGKPVYLASPGGRAATEFTLAESGSQLNVFENPTKDFPRRIAYWREGDVLVARVEGTIRGEARARQWRFERFTAP